MSSDLATDTLVAVSTLLLTSRERSLTADERGLLKRMCKELGQGVFDRPICNRALREFADALSASSLIVHGQTSSADLDGLMNKAESLKQLVG